MPNTPPGSKSVDQFAEFLKKKGNLPSTIENYSRDALHFLDFINDHQLSLDLVTSETVKAYEEQLSLSDKENSLRRKIIGAKQFFRFLSLCSKNDESQIEAAPIPRRVEIEPAPLNPELLQSLLNHAVNTTPPIKAKRDYAIICLLAIEGLKAHEIISLTWSNCLIANEQGSLNILGPKPRTIYLNPTTSLAMIEYRDLSKGLDHKGEAIFVAFKGRESSLVLPRMTRHGLKHVIYELGEKSGIDQLNTETLRHHAIDFQISQGKSPEEIMNHLGLKRPGNITKHFKRERHARTLAKMASHEPPAS